MLNCLMYYLSPIIRDRVDVLVAEAATMDVDAADWFLSGFEDRLCWKVDVE